MGALQLELHGGLGFRGLRARSEFRVSPTRVFRNRASNFKAHSPNFTGYLAGQGAY